MAFVARSAVGYVGSTVHFVGPEEVCWVCGNSVVLYNLSLSYQKILKGTSFSIKCIAVNRKQGLLAVAEKGINPKVHMYELLPEPALKATLNLSYELGYSALAFSADGERLAVCGEEPDCKLSIFIWRQSEVLVSASVQQPVTQISFHSHDPNRLVTSGQGIVTGWRIDKLWSRYDFLPQQVELPGYELTCHAWYPQGLYVGTSTGEVFALDPTTLQPYSLDPTTNITTEIAAVAVTAGGASSSQGGAPPSNRPPSNQAPMQSSSSLPRASISGAPPPQQSLSRAPSAFMAGPSQAPSPTGEPPASSVEPAAGSGVEASTQGPVMVATNHERLPVTAMSVNRDYLLVCTGAASTLWFAHGGPGQGFELRLEHSYCPTGTLACDYGGPEYSMALIGTADSKLILVDTKHGDLKQMPLYDCHVGTITGAVPTSFPEEVLTCGSDGTLRQWNMSDGNLVAKRTFASAQTCLTTAIRLPLAAVGSETGVVRLVALQPQEAVSPGGRGARPLQVTYRSRLHTNPIHFLAFSPDAAWLATGAKGEQTIWFLSVHSDGGATPLGQLPTPEPVTAMAWPEVSETDDSVLLSLASGAIMCVSAPIELMTSGQPAPGENMHLSPGQFGLTVKIVKLETPFMHMVCVPGEKYGDVYGMAPDRSLHKVVLPTESQAWAGVKGRLHKSSLKLQGHGKAEGAISLTPSKQLVLLGTADGIVSTRNLSLNTIASAEQTGVLHDQLAEGCSAVSFDITARYFITGGKDGTMFVYEMRGTSHLSRPPEVAMVAPGPVDQDAFDDMNELTAVEQLRKRQAEELVAAGEHDRQQVVHRLTALKRQLLECIRQNEDAPELERVERPDFIIDREMVSMLKTEAEHRVQAVRDQVRADYLRLECVAERIMQTCWNNMAEKGAKLTSMKSGTEVANFALHKYDDAYLRKVCMLRRVEVVEHKLLGVGSNDKEYRVTLDAQGNPIDPTSRPVEDIEDAGGSGEGGSGGSGGASGSGGDNLDALLYGDFDLSCPTRKAAQIRFLKHKVHEIKVRFNEEFAKVVKQKRLDADRIMDLNTRIEETLRDLAKLGATLPPDERFQPPFPEDMSSVLTVKEEEVGVERVVSEEERARLDAKNRMEGENMRRSQKDNAFERALKQMMGGTLASKSDGEDEFALARPEWMDGNPKLFSEEQLKEVREWQARERALQEEKAKRINTLEMELRTMKAGLEDVISKFDELLAGLATKKLKAQAEVYALESRVIALALNVDACIGSSDKVERELMSQLGTVKEKRGHASTELVDRRALLSEAQDRHATLAADEKQLDRNFKKEFMDTETHYPKLLHLYRLRVTASKEPERSHEKSSSPHDDGKNKPPSRQMSRQMSRQHSISRHSESNSHHSGYTHGGGAVASSSVGGAHPGGAGGAGHPPGTPLSVMARSQQYQALVASTLEPFPELPEPEVVEEPEQLGDEYRPEGLEMAWWDRFLSYRAQKVHCENEIRKGEGSLKVLRREVPALEAEEARMAAEMERLTAAITSVRNERKAALYDVDMQLRLKAGQVEAEPPGLVSADLSHAVFVHRKVVEGVNSVVRGKGGRKVEILTAIKDFKKGIYQLEWEHQRCDMMIEDLKEKTRELQLLHVTRDIQSVLKEGEDRSSATETANLEALAKQRERLHAKALLERQRRLRKLEAQIADKAAQNEAVAVHLVQLEKVLMEQQRLQASMQSVDEQAARRMRSMVTHKKLKEIAVAQQEEVRALRDELEQLRLRTYPTFVEPLAPLMTTKMPPDVQRTGGTWR